ncbi:MAG: Sapep family Mn(2+)-dependent dipeptidase [Limnochordaceae bacterium]|nr:Sapep family Mn(2+)-dependent dipeptidase [Limnochordaceae bacterium]
MTAPSAMDPVEQAARAWLQAHDAELVDFAVRLIRIESVEGPASPGRPFGSGVAEALGLVVSEGDRLGLETLDVDGYAVHARWGPPGEDVGVLTHVDVVPAGEGWSVPPFGGIIRDGRLVGRGAIDDKGPTAAALFALASLVAVGAPVRRGLRLIVGGDEETGFQCVRHYFRRHPYPAMAFAPDALFPVVFAEKGVLDLTLGGELPAGPLVRLVGGQRPNVVPDRATAWLELPPGHDAGRWIEAIRSAATRYRARIEASAAPDGRIVVESYGVATHGSTPEKGINAAAQLLGCLVDGDGDGLLDPTGALRFIARAGKGLHGQGLGIAERDDVSGPLTANLGVLRLEGGELRATFNVRYPVAIARADGLVARVRERASEAGLQVLRADDDPPHHVPRDSFLVRTLLEVYRRETGDDETPPLAIGGGTYARAVPGGVAYGPVLPFSGVVPHEKDESIELDHLRKLARIYAAALWALAR